jgi:hypothetical protein
MNDFKKCLKIQIFKVIKPLSTYNCVTKIPNYEKEFRKSKQTGMKGIKESGGGGKFNFDIFNIC